MADFLTTRTHVTKEPKIEVTFDSGKPLPVGTHVFQLVVKDDAGNVSLPAEVKVDIIDNQNPTAIVRLITARFQEPPGIGETFVLDGSNSTDIGGQIVTYEWTLLDR